MESLLPDVELIQREIVRTGYKSIPDDEFEEGQFDLSKPAVVRSLSNPNSPTQPHRNVRGFEAGPVLPLRKSASIKTGRQRKKNAARAKGGEFQAKREKKRVYFCCLGSELDVESLYEEIKGGGEENWHTTMYTNVLHILIRGPGTHSVPSSSGLQQNGPVVPPLGSPNSGPYLGSMDHADERSPREWGGSRSDVREGERGGEMKGESESDRESQHPIHARGTSSGGTEISSASMWHNGDKECFVFDFGRCAVVELR